MRYIARENDEYSINKKKCPTEILFLENVEYGVLSMRWEPELLARSASTAVGGSNVKYKTVSHYLFQYLFSRVFQSLRGKYLSNKIFLKFPTKMVLTNMPPNASSFTMYLV